MINRIFDEPNNEDIELLYLWIENTKYDCFSSCEFNFSSEFTFTFKNNLLEGKTTNNINVYKGTNIKNVSAIIGANGVGKTTLLNFISNLSGKAFKTYSIDKGNGNYISVFRCNNKICVFNYTDFEKIECEGNIFDNNYAYSLKHQDYNDLYAKTTIVYLSLEEHSSSSFLRKENSNFVPLTPSQIKNDLKFFGAYKTPLYIFKHINIISDVDNLVTMDYLANYVKEKNDVRVSITSFWDLLVDDHKKDQVEHFFNSGTQNVRIKNNMNELGFSKIFLRFFMDELISFFDINRSVYDLLFNDITEIFEKLYSIVELQCSIDKQEYLFHGLKEIKAFNDLEKYITNMSETKNKLEDDTMFFDIPIYKLRSLINLILNRKESFIFKYLNFKLNRSEGELSKIRHESYIYYLANRDKYVQKKYNGIKDNILLLLDEIDVHMHPEWQRTLIDSLIDSVLNILNNYSVQIILTTHSPIVLSDIPGDNVIYISNNNGIRKVFKKQTKTFGANIYTLYNDSFFFSNDVTIGEFAKRYINGLYKKLKENTIGKEEAKKAIELIGEPILRNSLLNYLGDNCHINEINKVERFDDLDDIESKLLDILNEIRKYK